MKPVKTLRCPSGLKIIQIGSATSVDFQAAGRTERFTVCCSVTQPPPRGRGLPLSTAGRDKQNVFQETDLTGVDKGT